MDVPKFIAAAAVIGSLDGAITYDASSLLVDGDVSGWPSSDFHVKIEDEIIHVGTLSGQTLSTLTRGALDTDDDHHPNRADVVYVKTADDFAANGNGGLRSPNWCMVAFDTPPALNQTNDFVHNFAADELTITAQSGSDFSVATVDGYGSIVSESGGMFQGGSYIGVPPIDGLDGADSSLRLLWFAFVIGTGPLQTLGLDQLVPLTKAGWNPGAASCVASLPGIVPPGGAAMQNPSVFLTGNADADSVDLGGVFLPSLANLAIWQIA